MFNYSTTRINHIFITGYLGTVLPRMLAHALECEFKAIGIFEIVKTLGLIKKFELKLAVARVPVKILHFVVLLVQNLALTLST